MKRFLKNIYFAHTIGTIILTLCANLDNLPLNIVIVWLLVVYLNAYVCSKVVKFTDIYFNKYFK